MLYNIVLLYNIIIYNIVLKLLQLLKTSRKLLGKKLHEKLLQTTVYGQFVIGQKKETVKPIIADYLASGVGPILYYALEEDKSSHSKSTS